MTAVGAQQPVWPARECSYLQQDKVLPQSGRRRNASRQWLYLNCNSLLIELQIDGRTSCCEQLSCVCPSVDSQCLWIVSVCGQSVSVASQCLWTVSVCGQSVSVDSQCLWTVSVCGQSVSVDSQCVWTVSVCGQSVSVDSQCLWTVSVCGQSVSVDSQCLCPQIQYLRTHPSDKLCLWVFFMF